MSSERDFLKTASSRFSRREADEFLEKLKTSGAADVAKGFKKTPELLAALGGAALATGVQYITSKRKKDGGPSDAQKAFKKMEEKTEPGPENKSFAKDLAHATSKSTSGFADVASRHPAKMAPFAAPVGAGLGLLTLMAIRRRLKGA